jgi:hypothetical protein
MVIVHYGYLVLKMPSPNCIIKVCGDRSIDVSTLEKLQALAVAQEAAASHGVQEQAPPSLGQYDSTSGPHVQTSDNEDIPVKVIQISTDTTQTTRIMGNLGDK